MLYNSTDMGCKLQRISVADILCQVQFKGQDMVFCNSLLKEVALEQIEKQIGLATSADAGNHFHLPIPHEGDDFLQIAVSFYFHVATSIENLLVLSRYFSMKIIHKCTRKIDGFIEMFVDKPANISMK